VHVSAPLDLRGGVGQLDTALPVTGGPAATAHGIGRSLGEAPGRRAERAPGRHAARRQRGSLPGCAAMQRGALRAKR